MKVILLEDINNLGKKYDVKEVADGYAKNFLIPKELAKPATKQALESLVQEKGMKAQKAEEELKRAQKIAASMEGLEVMIPVKIGKEQQLFESITCQKISEALKKIGFEIKKTQIALLSPIKEVGEWPIKINFEHNLEAEIKVIVSEEK